MFRQLKAFVFAASVIAVTYSPFVIAGPVDHYKRQEPSQDVPTSVAPSATSTLVGSSSSSASIGTTLGSVTTSSDVTSTLSTDTSAVTPSTDDTSITVAPSATQSAPNTSFTPFTGTFAPAPPGVSQIVSYEFQHPSIHSISFTVPKATSTPACNVLKCPLTTTTTVPVFPSPVTFSTAVSGSATVSGVSSLEPIPTSVSDGNFTDTVPVPTETALSTSDTLATEAPSTTEGPTTSADGSVSIAESTPTTADLPVPTNA